MGFFRVFISTGFVCLFAAFPSHAQDAQGIVVTEEPGAEEEPTPPPGPTPRPLLAPDADGFEKLPVDSVIAESKKKVVSGSLEVLDERDGVYTIKTSTPYPPGSMLIFMRMSRTIPEILAHGVVTGGKDGIITAKLNLETINKIPFKGDIVAPLEPPWNPKREVVDDEQSGAITAEPAPEPGDPGHIQFDVGSFNGKLNTVPSTDANLYKKVPAYVFQYQHFEWYLDFLWRLGFEYEGISGVFPTFSYYRRAETTSQSITSFILNYRLRRMFEDKVFRPTFRLIMTNDVFETTNTDEAIMSTKTTMLGVGARWALEFQSSVWLPDPKKWGGFTVHRAYLDTNVMPLVEARDALVTRGNSGNGMATEWRAGVTSFLVLNFIPYVNRFVIEGMYGEKAQNLQFSGKTTSETDGVYIIPENGKSEEKITYWVISVGVRLEDFIGKLFNPK